MLTIFSSLSLSFREKEKETKKKRGRKFYFAYFSSTINKSIEIKKKSERKKIVTSSPMMSIT